MPFDFKKFDAKCANMSPEELQREWEHYTRLISGAATSTAVSGVAIPFTLGVSVIGVGMAAPAIHNARKKREIIERHLQKLGTTHNTRKRDVLTPMAISGTVGVVTLGVGSFGADAIANAGAEHGVAMIVENEIVVKAGTHLALDAAVMKGEDIHATHKKEEERLKALHRASTPNGKMAEAGSGVYPVASYNLQQQYAPVPIPQSYTLNSESDSNSTYMGEKWSTYQSHPEASPSIPVTPAPQYSPPAYPGPPARSGPVAQPSESYFPPPSLSGGRMSAYMPTPAYTPDVKSPIPSQAAPSYSPNPMYHTQNEKLPVTNQNAAFYHPQPGSTNFLQPSPLPTPVAAQVEQQTQQPSQQHQQQQQQQQQQHYQPQVQTYASYPGTILPSGHAGQYPPNPGYATHQSNPSPTSPVTSPPMGMAQAHYQSPQMQPPTPYPPLSTTQPQTHYQSPQMQPTSPYTLPPTPAFSPPATQHLPYFPPPPGTPFTSTASPRPGPSPIIPQYAISQPPPPQQLYSPPRNNSYTSAASPRPGPSPIVQQPPHFQPPPPLPQQMYAPTPQQTPPFQQQPPPPQHQNLYSPPPTPFSPYSPTSQPTGYFSQAPAHPSGPMNGYPTPAATPYSEHPLEKQQQQQQQRQPRPSITAQMFPPPPTLS